VNLLSTRWRGFSANNLFSRIKRLIDKFSINYFYFVDDNFFVDSNRAKEFCKIINKSRYQFNWIVSGTVKRLSGYNNNFFKELHNSGCNIIHIGIESGSQRIVNLMDKERFKIKDIINLNKKLKKHNIIPYYDIVLGHYGETLKDIKKTVKLIFRLIKDNKNAQFSALHCLSLYPNTRLYNKLINDKIITETDSSSYKNSWSEANMPWVSIKRKKLIERLYFCSLFIDNKIELIDSVPIKVFSRLYRLIAIFRMKNLYFKYMFEHKLLNLSNVFQ
jgi:radical SAM superfamily enzyme YgiQ (UPF0313 family)